MLDVFRVGVHIGMTTNSTQVLGTMLRELGLVRGSAAELEKTLGRLKWTIGGAVSAMAGFETLKGLWHLVDAGKELNKELERTRQLGGDFANSLPQTRQTAIETAQAVPTTTPSENVKVLRELGTQLQNNDAAREILPMAQRAAYVIHNFTGEAVDDIIKNLVKVADIRAQIFSIGPDGKEHVDPAKVRSEMDAATKGLILGGGYINSSALVTMARQAGVPAKAMTQEAFYAAMVEAAVSQGAARAGTSTTSLFSQLVGGTMPVHVAKEEQRMGLLRSGEWYSDHGHVVLSPAAQKRFEAVMKDPMEFITGPLNDLMTKRGMNAEQKIAEVFKLFGRQTTQRLVAEGLSSEPQFARSRSMFHEIPSADEQYRELQARDLDTNITSFKDAWTGLMQVLGEQGVPVAIGILHGMTDALHAMTAWAAANPDAARHLMEGAAGVAAFMALGGTMVVFTTTIGPFTAAMRLLLGVLTASSVTTAAGIASSLGAGLTALAAGISTLAAVAIPLGILLKPTSTQSAADDRAPYGGKSLHERFPGLVVPNSQPLGLVPGTDHPEAASTSSAPGPQPTTAAHGDMLGTAANPMHMVLDNHDQVAASVGAAAASGTVTSLTNAATAPKSGPSIPQVRTTPIMPGLGGAPASP